MSHRPDIAKNNPKGSVSNGARQIVQIGDDVLRGHAKAIRIQDIRGSHIKKLISDMKALLAKEEYGVAIAAPQVGEALRLFIVSGKAMEKRKRSNRAHHRTESDERALNELPAEDEVYINPELIKLSRGRQEKHEGCLSVRGRWGMVPRAQKATLRAFNERGEQFTRGASGLLAQIFQHELDHLDGVLYIDKATELHEEESTDADRKPA